MLRRTKTMRIRGKCERTLTLSFVNEMQATANGGMPYVSARSKVQTNKILDLFSHNFSAVVSSGGRGAVGGGRRRKGDERCCAPKFVSSQTIGIEIDTNFTVEPKVSHFFFQRCSPISFRLWIYIYLLGQDVYG